LGHDPEETVGDTAWEYIHPDDREAVVETFEEWKTTPGTTATVEYRAHHAEGSWRWMEARGTNQRDNPTVEGYVVNSRDITDRKEGEEQAKRERERYTTLFESLPNPVLHARVENGESVIQDVNAAFERTFGHDTGGLRGERLHDYILPDDRTEAVEQLNRQILDEGEVRTEVRRETTDGVRTFRLDVNIRNERGTQPEGYAIYTDITDREERERELEILRTAIDHAHIPLVLADPSQADNPLVYVNDAFEEVTGYSRSEAIGNNCRFLQGEQTDPEKVATLRNAVENEEPVTVDLRNYRKDGEMFWNRLSIRPIYDDDGELLRYFGSQQDITEQTESRRRIEQQNERLDEFASVISHDLRNPLQVAEGRLELASEECDSEHLTAVADAHDRMETLTQDLLTLAREGTRVDEVVPVQVRTAVEKSWRTVETDEATLTVESEQTLRADPTRFQQLLENLVRNAIDHGGDDVHIVVGACDDGTGFYVADDGPGIPEADREAVFDSGYSTDPDGTGFGLAIVQAIVHNHGWEITVTESQDGGARFEITGIGR
jgi:PAS domain S-box-containing protein